MGNWWEPFIGKPYGDGYDCMSLAVEVAALFGHKVVHPSYAPNVRAQARAVAQHKETLSQAQATAQDGDPVLFLCRARFYHIGVFVNVDDTAYILHADQRSAAVILTKLTDMPVLGYTLEGFYKWRT